MLAGVALVSLVGLASLPSAKAGIPSAEQKWMSMGDNNQWVVDTEDVQMKGGHLRFYVERRAKGGEHAAAGSSWQGKVRVSCEDFHSRIEVYRGGLYGYTKSKWEKIKPGEAAYELAYQLCFLTGRPGYTAESNPPQWAQKIINKFQGNSNPEAVEIQEDFIDVES